MGKAVGGATLAAGATMVAGPAIIAAAGVESAVGFAGAAGLTGYFGGAADEINNLENGKQKYEQKKKEEMK